MYNAGISQTLFPNMHDLCKPSSKTPNPQRFHKINQVDETCCLYSSTWSGVAAVAVVFETLFSTLNRTGVCWVCKPAVRHVCNTKHRATHGSPIIEWSMPCARLPDATL
ncbi:TPA: hypothetical protein ACH3X3_009620 [Trebouxia sp. C0006]